MKCPHCGYEDGFNGESMTNIDGEHGGFYKLLDVLKRTETPGVVQLYGCPACDIVFMDRW